MKGSRRAIAIGAVCLVLAAVVALLAYDIRAWPETVRAGDVQVRVLPGRPDPWGSPATLPLDPAKRLLGIEDDLEYRHTVRLFLLTRARYRRRFGVSFLTPLEAVQRRFRRIELNGRNPARRSAAANFRGVLTEEASGLAGPEFVQKALRHFRDAVRLDPSNEQAKFNLELLLYRTRPQNPGGRGILGNIQAEGEGAGSTIAGRGY